MAKLLPKSIYTPLPTFFKKNDDDGLDALRQHVVFVSWAGTIPVTYRLLPALARARQRNRDAAHKEDAGNAAMDTTQKTHQNSFERKRHMRPLLRGDCIDYANHILETLPRANATDPLIFKDISFLGESGFPDTTHVTRAELKLFHDFLGEAFDSVAVSYYGTFIEIECIELPAADQRPFSIGGFIALWATPGSEQFLPILGDTANGPNCELEETYRGQNFRDTIPTVSAVEYLANNIFPDCEALSFIDRELVVEMPETAEDTWHKKLNDLPHGFNGTAAVISYHNGPLATTVHARRAIQPDPSHLQALIADETDYVAQDGKVYPGTMVSSLNAQGHVSLSVSAGIMVQNDRHSRLVCPYHTWAELDQKDPGVLGQGTEQARRVFAAAQGADGDTAGSVFGHLEQRLPDSDIGLVKVNEEVAFESVLMDTDIRPKALLRLENVRAGDDYLFESFVTGRQWIKCIGRRFPITRRRATALLSPDNTGYVKLAQGVFATNTSVSTRQPAIRDRVCGSMLLEAVPVNYNYVLFHNPPPTERQGPYYNTNGMIWEAAATPPTCPIRQVLYRSLYWTTSRGSQRAMQRVYKRAISQNSGP
ncbi:hypothetical protein F503_03261 [Ophiostoma piceae UAMH 11346]|uniref:Uncharacterized protein n=1 Tax=Ophiostoma piceae (strain UAMH 11346) TaxID=1262450 RepID=S3BZX5_OPHP1|nr:hypothetical protein F503_03261 [Ophiostoma piceae UAMH 11346]